MAIEFADLHFGDLIGEGSYAVVLRGVWKHSRAQGEVAIKRRQLHESSGLKEVYKTHFSEGLYIVCTTSLG